MRPRVLLAGGLVAALAGIFLAWGPPLLVATNAGLTVTYPWFRTAGAALALAGLVIVAASVRSKPGRVLLALVALGALGPLVFLARYRLDVDADGIRQRVLATDTLFWSQVVQVDPRADGIVVRGPEGPPMWIDTVGMRPSDRAILDRGIARRLTDAFAPAR